MLRWLVLVVARAIVVVGGRAVTGLAGAILRLGRRDSPPASMFDQALEFTENLPSRTESEFAGVRVLNSYVLGMLYNVAERLIDANERGREPNALDEALITLCNRLFNESLAGYTMLSRGLLGPALHHLRAAVEINCLAILFLDQPKHAEPWLNGKEYRPGEVRKLIEARKLINAPEELRKWYSHLSKMTHANAAASATSVYPLGDDAEILFYGGHRAPQTAVSTAVPATAVAFIWIVLGFLRSFYDYRSDDLEEISLLWKPEVAEIASEIDLTWDRLLKLYENMAEDIQREILATPEDGVPPPDWVEEILAHRAWHSPDRAADSQP